MVVLMTKAEAQALAKWDRDYAAKPIKNTHGRFWGVWCWSSDHWVEFDQSMIDEAEANAPLPSDPKETL